MDVEERFNKWKQKYGLALGNNATQLLLIIAGDAIATLKAEQREHEALFKEIEARAPEQGGEMREALERIIDHAEDWHAHYCEMWGERRKEQQDAILGDIMNARAALAPSAPEEPKP